MNNMLKTITLQIYHKLGLIITDFKAEEESKEYAACRFKLNGLNIICRNAKITPKKVGQFVTFWKRAGKGSIEPFNENDPIDFFIINVVSEEGLGQFVFPKTILIQKSIISTDANEGKRAFRVYPKWNISLNKQAEQTQKWQLSYFYEAEPKVDLQRVAELYEVTQLTSIVFKGQ